MLPTNTQIQNLKQGITGYASLSTWLLHLPKIATIASYQNIIVIINTSYKSDIKMRYCFSPDDTVTEQINLTNKLFKTTEFERSFM